MVQIDPAKDLAAMFNPPQQERYSGMRYGQGTILTWNPATFENTVSFRSLTLTNLPILGKIDGLSLKAGDIVGLMGWAPNGGFGAWWILGELGTPPLSEPVAVEGGANFVVRDGGFILVEDGGVLRSENSSDNKFAELASGLFRVGRLSDEDIGGLIEFLDFGGFGSSIQIESLAGGLTLRGQTTTRLTADEDGAQLQLSGGGSVLMSSGSDASDRVQIISTGEGIFGIASNGDCRWDAQRIILDADTDLIASIPLTTSNSPNLWGTDSLVNIRRSTSSVRYKTDISDLVIDPDATRRLRPRAWRDRSEVAADPDTDRWHVGLIAEEVAEAGLREFVDYTKEGEPDRVLYDRLCVALLALNRDQDRRLSELESRMSAFDGQAPSRPEVRPTLLPVRRGDPEEPRARSQPMREHTSEDSPSSRSGVDSASHRQSTDPRRT